MALPLGEWGKESREGIKPSRAVLQTALLSENRLIERTAGIEPASAVWKTAVLPLNDLRERRAPGEVLAEVVGLVGDDQRALG